MNRRDLMKLGLLAGAGSLAAPVAADGAHAGFDVVEKDLATLQAEMTAGRLTALGLTQAYLARIGRIAKAGPRLNAVIELNPEALAIARALDEERKAKGPRGPLHGIPVLLKDNIATGDQQQTTAGSLALEGVRAARDSGVASRLRAAGAVLLGKTNLSEWANLRGARSTSGWSARGGLTLNPYALDRNTSGSSSGSAAAAAASLCAVAVGTETDGSIVSPSSYCGLVGLKPTVGLVSRAGIIPLSHTQDTAGPMARTVADAAALLTALAGPDPRDEATKDAALHAVDYTKLLDKGALAGKRLGVVRGNFGGRNELASAVVQEALGVLQAQGAVLVDPVAVPNTDKYGQSELEVLLTELKADLAAWLAEYAPDAKVKSLADVIAFNEAHKDRELRWFGQEHFLRAQAKGGLDSKEYLEALANNRRYARAEGLGQVLAEHKLDALVAPSASPAFLTDYIRGDNSGGGFSSPAAVAGYPHLTVPAGYVFGLPVGISFVGTAWSEGLLLQLGYAFEQARQPRKAPTYPRSVNVPG